LNAFGRTPFKMAAQLSMTWKQCQEAQQ
jgi:hypothetical protein